MDALLNPVFQTQFEHNDGKFHSVVLPLQEYIELAAGLGAKNIIEIPALFILNDEATEWLFDKFEIEDREAMLTISPDGFAEDINEKNLRHYLDLHEKEGVHLQTHLDPDMYTKVFREAPPNVISYCVFFTKQLKSASDRGKIIDDWVEGLPPVIDVKLQPWWGRYLRDTLDTLSVAEVHHRALRRLDHFYEYLMKIMVGTCYFFSTQDKDPYLGE